MKARLLLALACALVTFVASAAPALAVEPVVVVDTDKPEIGPAASTTYLAWFVVTPNFHPNVRAQAIGDDTSFRVNAKGTSAVTGGIDGSTMIYQWFTSDHKPDLAMIDLSTRTALDVPEGVNTNAAEFGPSISGSHLLFGRGIPHGASVVLFDTSTATSEVLYTKTETERRAFDITPTQVNGNYAVWMQTTYSKRTERPVRGDIFLYDIAAATTTKLPDADIERPAQYGLSVDADGTVYFGRSNKACGENAQIISRDTAGTETVLYEFPTGRDFGFSFAVDNANNTTDVYFDGGKCRGSDFADILKLPGV